MSNSVLSATAAGYAWGGKRIAVVARDLRAARTILEDTAMRLSHAGKLKKTHLAAMQVESSTGGVVDFLSVGQRRAYRGREYDIIYVDEHGSQDLIDDLVPCMLRTKGTMMRFDGVVLAEIQ